MFDSVNSFVLFIGYPRSGHSIFGSIVDAHKNAVISHELMAVKFILDGTSYKDLLNEIVKNSEYYGKHGRFQSEKGKTRTKGSYEYSIDRQWQGKHDTIRVIGDKSGGMTTRLAHKSFGVFDQVQNRIPVPIKWIHVTRNPFDMISTSCYRKGKKVPNPNHIDLFFSRCETNAKAIEKFNDRIITIKHEDLISTPVETIGLLCDFLDIPKYGSYIEDCASIVYPSPSRTRSKIKWSGKLIKHMNYRMKKFSFLKDYSYEN